MSATGIVASRGQWIAAKGARAVVPLAAEDYYIELSKNIPQKLAMAQARR